MVTAAPTPGVEPLLAQRVDRNDDQCDAADDAGWQLAVELRRAVGVALQEEDVRRRDAALVELAKRLVKTSAVHTMLVLLDDAQRKGATDQAPPEGGTVGRLRNPDDVLQIEVLRRRRGETVACAFESEHAAIGTVAGVLEWSRAQVRMLRDLAERERAPLLEVWLRTHYRATLYPPIQLARFAGMRVVVPIGDRDTMRMLWVQEGFEAEAKGFLADLTRGR